MKAKSKGGATLPATSCCASSWEMRIAEKAIEFLVRDPHCIQGTIEQAVKTAIIRLTVEKVSRKRVTDHAKSLLQSPFKDAVPLVDDMVTAWSACHDCGGRGWWLRGSKKMVQCPTCIALISQHNVKEHAPLSAAASVDHGVEGETTGEHENRAADRGCCVSTCSGSSLDAEECALMDGYCLLIEAVNLFTAKNPSYKVKIQVLSETSEKSSQKLPHE